MSGAIRVGIDVGGTFTKAVAVETGDAASCARTPRSRRRTTRGAASREGVADALRALLDELGDDRRRVELVAFSTTQAMNALLEGDVGPRRRGRASASSPICAPRASARGSAIGRARARAALETAHAFLDATGGVDVTRVDARARAARARPAALPSPSAAPSRSTSRARAVRRAQRARARAPGLRRPRAHGRVRARDADGQRRDQREHPARRRADDDARRARARRGGARRAAARAARRRRRDERRGVPPPAVVHDRLRARSRRRRGAAPARAHGRDRRRVRRHELERLGHQARPAVAPDASGDGPPDLRPLDRQLGRRRRRREHGAGAPRRSRTSGRGAPTSPGSRTRASRRRRSWRTRGWSSARRGRAIPPITRDLRGGRRLRAHRDVRRERARAVRTARTRPAP